MGAVPMLDEIMCGAVLGLESNSQIWGGSD